MRTTIQSLKKTMENVYELRDLFFVTHSYYVDEKYIKKSLLYFLHRKYHENWCEIDREEKQLKNIEKKIEMLGYLSTSVDITPEKRQHHVLTLTINDLILPSEVSTFTEKEFNFTKQFFNYNRGNVR